MGCVVARRIPRETRGRNRPIRTGHWAETDSGATPLRRDYCPDMLAEFVRRAQIRRLLDRHGLSSLAAISDARDVDGVAGRSAMRPPGGRGRCRRHAAVRVVQQAPAQEPVDRSRASLALPMQIGECDRRCASCAFGDSRVWRLKSWRAGCSCLSTVGLVALSAQRSGSRRYAEMLAAVAERVARE